MPARETEEKNMHKEGLSAQAALEKLKEGNARYINAASNPGDISPEMRRDTCENGQSPYAVVVACSDSRVIPEGIFSAGIGELFVIRVAGNVIDRHQLGSIEYAADHLGTKLVVILGHDHCGAVHAAICDEPDGFVKSITDEIRLAIGAEKDEYRASCLNVEHSVAVVKQSPGVQKLMENGLEVKGAIYHIGDGTVEFFD